jgi:hypothetical protein
VSFTFVSMPDFFNADIGDVRTRDDWDGAEEHNSYNEHYASAIDLVLSQVASEPFDALFLAGDHVEGHWEIDADNTGIFGPDDTDARRDARIDAAGAFYYSQLRSMLADHGIPWAKTHLAIGDHEIGDDRADKWPPGSYRHRAIPVCKRVWARHFTLRKDESYRYGLHPAGRFYNQTAYAVDLGANLRLVTVDVFHRHPAGVDIDVRGAQLDWLNTVCARAKAAGKVVIVQGHTPILEPVRYMYSGRLHVGLSFGAEPKDRPGYRSDLWSALVRHKIDLYLCGEVHDITMRVRSGVAQVSHGALFPRGTNYMLGKVYDDGTIEMTLKKFTVHTDTSERLWQTSNKRPARIVGYEPVVRTVGTAAVRNNSVLYRTGMLRPYSP